MPAEKFVSMGHAGKAHGIKGELSLTWHGDFLPPPGAELFFRKPGVEAVPRKLVSARWHKGKLLAVFEGVPDRTMAETLAGSEVLLRKSDLPPLEEGEFYLDDLLGAAVYLEDGREAGILDHLEFPADQEIWVIKAKDGQEILFPAREEFITSIDADKRKIIISPPPGLLDIYLA